MMGECFSDVGSRAEDNVGRSCCVQVGFPSIPLNIHDTADDELINERWRRRLCACEGPLILTRRSG